MTTPRTKIIRGCGLALALSLLCLLALGGVGALGWDWLLGLLENTVVLEAQKRGVELKPGSVEAKWGAIRVHDSRFALVGVPSVTGTVGTIDIKLDWTSPKTVTVSNVSAKVNSADLPLLKALLDWRQKFVESASAGPPISWAGMNLTIQAVYPTPFEVSLKDVQLSNASPKMSLVARSATVSGIEVSPLRLAFEVEKTGVEVGFGSTTLEQASWRLAIHEAVASTRLDLRFASLALGELLSKLGLSIADTTLSQAQVAGAISTMIARSGAATGVVALELEGWVPPHPVELQGFGFSSTTKLNFSFATDAAQTVARLSEVRMQSGNFVLKGDGRVDREGLALRLQLDLHGELSCAALAGALAESNLGKAFGAWARRTAPRAIKGSVGIRVQVDADTRRLNQPKVVRKIGVGCGLRPMTVEQLLDLDLPPMPDAESVGRLMQQLSGGHLPSPKDLLPLPSGLPSWPLAPASSAHGISRQDPAHRDLARESSDGGV